MATRTERKIKRGLQMSGEIAEKAKEVAKHLYETRKQRPIQRVGGAFVRELFEGKRKKDEKAEVVMS